MVTFSLTHKGNFSIVLPRKSKFLSTVGRLDTPELAEQVLSEGKADLIAAARPFLSDPHWPNKVARGEEDQIRQCLACNYCLWALFQQRPIACLQNASVGREGETRIHPTVKAKKVFVIGGGPGGLEAARVAKKRGHRVIFWEKSSRLGGQILLAITAPHKQNLMRCVEWLTREVEREGVEVKLNTEVTAENIGKEKPDVVIVASGALPISRFEYSGPNFFNAWEVLGGKDTGKRVIVLGGGMVGMETAEFLYQKGCEVTVITSRDSMDKLAVDMEPFNQALLLERLADSNISVTLSAEILEVRKGQVLFRKDGKQQSLEAETIVLAGGSQANNELSSAPKGKVPHLVSIGDCVEPRKAKDAIHEGFFAGLKI